MPSQVTDVKSVSSDRCALPTPPILCQLCVSRLHRSTDGMCTSLLHWRHVPRFLRMCLHHSTYVMCLQHSTYAMCLQHSTYVMCLRQSTYVMHVSPTFHLHRRHVSSTFHLASLCLQHSTYVMCLQHSTHARHVSPTFHLRHVSPTFNLRHLSPTFYLLQINQINQIKSKTIYWTWQPK